MKRKEAARAGTWLRAERDRMIWSRADLVIRMDQLATDFHWEGEMPNVDDVSRCEEGMLVAVPRWLKLARYAFERAAVPEGADVAWLGERNPFFTLDPQRMTQPLLFEDEWKLVAALDKLSDDHRGALKAFVSDFAFRQAYASKEKMAGKLLSKLGIDTEVVCDVEREMLTLLRAMRQDQRGGVVEIVRTIAKGRVTG